MLASSVFASSLSRPEWNFSQVVGITVWAPVIVEYIYLEIRTYPMIPLCMKASAKHTDCRGYENGISISNRKTVPCCQKV